MEGGEQLRRQEEKFQNYLPTLHKMTQNYPPMSHLTRDDIIDAWKQTPPQEKNGILLLAQFQEFFDQIHNKRSDADQAAVIERDSNRKNDEYFRRYVKNEHQACDNLVDKGVFQGHWYISQSGKTELERDLDESGIDKIIEADGAYYLIQFATTPGNMRDKERKFREKFGPKFANFPFVVTIPVRGDDKQEFSVGNLESVIIESMQGMPGFGSDIMDSVFGGR